MGSSNDFFGEIDFVTKFIFFIEWIVYESQTKNFISLFYIVNSGKNFNMKWQFSPFEAIVEKIERKTNKHSREYDKQNHNNVKKNK